VAELSSSRDDYAKFAGVDTEIIGISANHPFSQKAFADFLKLNFPILSDFPDLKVIDSYGVLNKERRLAQRSYFVVDKKGIVRFKKLINQGEPLVPNDTLVEEIRKMSAS
jgi:peroxiredoxin